MLITIIIIVTLLWVTFTFILPPFIGALAKVTGIFKSHNQSPTLVADNATLAPPVLSVPYEATNSGQIDIHGFTTANSKVKIYLDDVLVTTTDADETGAFTAKDVSLSLGTNNIYGKTEDDKGTESLLSKTIRLIYDNENPPLEVSFPTDGQIFSGEKKINVTGKTEPGVTITVNGDQAIVNSDGNFSKQITLNDGSNSLSFKSTDQASNFIQITRNVTFNP
mgnify:FL=1